MGVPGQNALVRRRHRDSLPSFPPGEADAAVIRGQTRFSLGNKKIGPRREDA